MAQYPGSKAIIEDVQKWMHEFVEKPNPLLGGWAPCPYAREARLENRLTYSCHAGAIDRDSVLSTVKDFSGVNHLVSLMIYPDLKDYSLKECLDQLKILREELIPRGYYVLMDHPSRPEPMNGIDFSNGKYGLLLIQKIDDLLKAVKALKDKGYYESWDADYFERVVLKRAQLINEFFAVPKSESS